MDEHNTLLDTKRLLLRQVEESDRNLFLRLFCDHEMMRYLGEAWSEEVCLETLKEWRDEWGKNNYYYGVMVRKDTLEGIGIAGITENTNPEEPGIEFSWFVLPEHQGKGYASEITRALLGFVFNDLKKDRLFAETHPENAASNRVLEKMNFKRIGEREHKYEYLPEFDRQVLWEIQRSDWEDQKS
jgi:[ribosomal protein S5]-alanine N-acetyltransferase